VVLRHDKYHGLWYIATMKEQDFANTKWNTESYAMFMSHIKSLADEKFRKFNMSIVNDTSVEHIGVRMSVLNIYVRQIAKGDWQGFIAHNTHKTLEELLLHGKLIGKVKIDFETLMQMLNEFIPYIKSWAVCDTAIAKFKQIKGNEVAAIPQIKKWAASNNPWAVRAALKMLLSNFLTADYTDTVFAICRGIKSEHYYVRMVQSWLVAEYYAQFPEQTHKFLESKCLLPWVQNKAIQKIRESYRVSAKSKQELLKLKI
jgi:3-methyladenine DNA glycosylase AlkD